MVRFIKRKRSNFRTQRHRKISDILQKQDRYVNNRLNNNESSIQSDDDNNEQREEASFSMKLKIWAINHNITRSALSDLLKNLISIGLTWLPSDARTILNTPRNIEVTNEAGGKFWYRGIKYNLCRIFSKLTTDMNLTLNFNLDGIPLYRSSKQEFWPILGKIHGIIFSS